MRRNQQRRHFSNWLRQRRHRLDADARAEQSAREAGTSPPSLRTAAAVSLVAFSVIATGSAVAAERIDAAIEDAARQAIDVRSEAISAATNAEIVRYLDTLRLVAATLTAVDTIDADVFDTATAPLADMDLAGATSLAFLVPPVAAADVDELESLWRTRGSSGLDLVPADDGRTEHLFSIFSTPLDASTANRTGIDVSVATAPHEALMEAWRSGGPALSDAYELIIDQQLPAAQRQTSFSLTLPVVRNGRHLGWVLMGIRGQDFLGHVLDHAAEGKVTARLVADDITGEETTVAAVPTTSALSDIEGLDGRVSSSTSDYARTLDLAAVQRQWTVQVAADEADLVGAARYRPGLIGAGGLLGAALMAALTWAVLSRRIRTRTHVAAATAELVAAEAATRREAALFTATLDTIDDVGVSVIDETGAFLLHSRAARAILGIDVDFDADAGGTVTGIGEAAGIADWQQHYGMFGTDGTEFPAESTPLVRALAGEAVDGVEMVIRNAVKADGVHVVVSGRPIDLGEGRRGALAVFRDVTHERQQHAELTGFAGVVAHDLKHPLTVITAYLDVLAEDILPALHGEAGMVAAANNHLHRVRAASWRMAQLIDGLLAYTTAQDAQLSTELVNLDDLVRETLSDLIPSEGPDAQTQPHIHVGELPAVEADPDRLRQVLANVISNAVKYVAPGATPHIDVTAETYKAAGTLRARILVADRGVGIAQRDRTRVLKPFERAHAETHPGAEYAGTGLGLAICTRIVRRHGGTLTLQPNPGGGTIAVIDLPFVQPRVTQPEPAPQPHIRRPDSRDEQTRNGHKSHAEPTR